MDRQLLDEITGLTFRFDLGDRSEDVTVPFDFADLTSREVERVAELVEGRVDEGPRTVAAFFFVKAARQLPLSDEDFAPFCDGFVPVLEGDETALQIEGVS